MASAEYEAYYRVVRTIPRGRVMTYGDVAAVAGHRGRARRVGYALHALAGDAVPWWRVVNAAGAVSPRAGAADQRALLEREGVTFDDEGRLDLRALRYLPPLDAIEDTR